MLCTKATTSASISRRRTEKVTEEGISGAKEGWVDTASHVADVRHKYGAKKKKDIIVVGTIGIYPCICETHMLLMVIQLEMELIKISKG